MFTKSVSFLLTALALSVSALVTPEVASVDAEVVAPISTLEARATTRLSAAQISGYAPYTQLARAAYCAPKSIKAWNCGGACSAVLGFNATLNGGDGNGVQYYYVGTWKDKKTIAVAHQGTDPTKFMSVLTDLNFFFAPLDPTLFPGAPADAMVHGGFADAHGDTGTIILTEVKRLLALTGYTSVTVVGHSLGGAIAELDALMFRLSLPASISIKAVTYGTPRVGNPAFAHYFDSKVTDFTRINNDDNPIPIVPGRGLGFLHPKGEVHFLRSGYAVGCDGSDNATDELCQIKSVPTILQGNIINHLGPYEGIWIGTTFCN